MKKRNKIALGVFAIFYIAYGTALSLNQEKVIYQPWPQDFESCTYLQEADIVVHNGTRMYVHGGEQGMVVLYHGNAGSACDRSVYAEQFIKAGYGYVLVEYAGYSNDTQDTTHELVKQDVHNVIAYLDQHGFQNVAVVGESVGTGAASYHASLRAPDKILLISPFVSLTDVAQRKFWFYPAFLLVDNAFDNKKLLTRYSGPVTIIHGDSDMIISQKSGLKLYASLSTEQKEFVSVEGFGHNNLFSSLKIYEVIQQFLEEVD